MASNSKTKRTNIISLQIIITIILSLVFGSIGALVVGRGNDGAQADTVNTAAQGEWINKVKKAGVLKIGMAEAAPGLTRDSKGNWTGPWTVPANALAKSLGVKAEYVSTTWANSIAGLQAGKYDLMAGLDVNLERTKSVEFSNAFYEVHNVFIVKRDSGLTDEDAILKNKLPVSEPQGSSQELALKYRDSNANILSVDAFPAAIQALNANRAVGILAPPDTAIEAVKQNPSLGIVVPKHELSIMEASFGLPQGIDQQSLSLINAAILESVNSGQASASYLKAGIETDIANGRVVVSIPEQYRLA